MSQARRPEGTLTRGTTAPNRLRRVDRWIAGVHGPLLRRHERPLVVDLGYGASPVTTAELRRLGVEVVAEAERPGDSGMVEAVVGGKGT